MPTYAVTADSARWSPKTMSWAFLGGASIQMLPDDEALTLIQRAPPPGHQEGPRDLLIEPKNPEEMTFDELGRYIGTLRNSGNDTKKLEVQRAEAGAFRRVPDHRPLRGSARGGVGPAPGRRWASPSASAPPSSTC